MTIQWRSSSPIFIALLFLCISWDAFLIFWYTTPSAPGNPWPLAAMGVGLTYLTLAGLVRRTEFSVTPEAFRMLRGPWPWTERIELRSDQIRHAFVQSCSGTESSESSLYNVCILDNDGRQSCAIKGLVEEQQALFLEQEIERFLKLGVLVDGGLQRD